jgi:hypothetical protein
MLIQTSSDEATSHERGLAFCLLKALLASLVIGAAVRRGGGRLREHWASVFGLCYRNPAPVRPVQLELPIRNQITSAHAGRLSHYFFCEPLEPVVLEAEPLLFIASNTDIPCGPIVITTGSPSFDFA